MPPLLELAANTQGQDFVVSDLHGCRHLLEAKLHELAFNPITDRIFSVGDLIDRGPDSWGTLRLIEQPWFFFVQGNHEEMLLALLEASNGPWIVDAESAWLNALNPRQIEYLQRVLVPILESAPIAIQIGSGLERFFVVHADRSRHTPNHYQLVPDHALAETLNEDEHQRSAALWSRRLFKDLPTEYAQENDVCMAVPAYEADTGLTYVGHSVVRKPILYRSHLFIDTGAYESGVLTVLRAGGRQVRK